MSMLAVNVLGFVEAPSLGNSPYAVDRDGRPYLPVGDGGIVRGLRLGDGAWAYDADHAAPGVTLVHPDQAARHALIAFACLGNEAVVRTGSAAGAAGRVLGKRGEAGRVIVVFDQPVLDELLPGDAVSVRAFGQGAQDGPVWTANVDPGVLAALPVRLGERVEASVRERVPSHLVGNGIGRPAQLWDLDVQLSSGPLRLGDLMCIDDLDVRHNVGYRRGWSTVGIVVHGGSPLPGHGPGVMPILCGPATSFDVHVDVDDHVGVTASVLGVGDA